MRFPGFEGEWNKAVFAEVCKIATGNKNTQDREEGGLYPFYVRSATIERINSYNFDGEAILTAGDGVGVGKVFHYTNGKIGVHQRVYILSEFKSVVGKFLFYYFSAKFNDRVSKLSAKNSVDSVRHEMIAKMPLAFPGVKEQSKISGLFSALDERIETQSKIIDNLKSQIKVLGQGLFTQKIKFKDNNDVAYQKWENKPGNEVFDNISNKRHNSGLQILAITQEHGAIPRDLIDYQISVTEKSVDSYKVVEVGDFIISLRSFQGGIEYSAYNGICSPAYIILREKISIDKHFYKHYFKSDNYIRLLNEKLEGIRDGKIISYKYFSDIYLPYPSLDEQIKISSFLSVIEGKIETEKNILKQFKAKRKYMLAKLFT